MFVGQRGRARAARDVVRPVIEIAGKSALDG